MIANNWYTDTDVFPEHEDQKDAVQIAIGLVDLEDWTGTEITDPAIIELNIYVRHTASDSNIVRYEQLDLKSCDKTELGLDTYGEAMEEGGTKFRSFDSALTQKLV